MKSTLILFAFGVLASLATACGEDFENHILLSVSVDPESATLTIGTGDSVQLIAIGHYDDDSEGPLPGVVWRTSDASILVLDRAGLASAGDTPGTAQATALLGVLVSSPATIEVVDGTQ